MLIDVILIVVGSFVTVLFTTLGIVSLAVPDAINDALLTLGSYVGRLQPLFPVDTFASVMVFLLSFIGFYYAYRLILKVWGWIRGADYRS